MRFRFYDLFRENPNHTLTPIRTIQIGGAVIGRGVTFGPGVIFGGIEIYNFRGNDIDAEEVDGVMVIRGFYG